MIFSYKEGWYKTKYLSHEFNMNSLDEDKQLNDIHSWILENLKNVKVTITRRDDVGWEYLTMVKYTFKFTNDADFVAFKMMWL